MAAELFASRGYHSTGIDDIGAAAGITGGGVYRHFTGKQAILVALIERAVECVQEQLLRPLDEDASARRQLHALVQSLAQSFVQERDLAAVYFMESYRLTREDRARMQRKQRAVFDKWIELLHEVRPDLTATEARTAVQAAIGVLTSTVRFPNDVESDRLREALINMTMGVLLAGWDRSEGGTTGDGRAGEGRVGLRRPK